jgi:hypothetical protein
MPGLNRRIFGAAAMSVCGRGLTTPVVPMVAAPGTPPAQRPLIEFLGARRETIGCDEIPSDVPVDGLDGMQRASRYLLFLAESSWRLSGLSWAGIDRLLGLLFAISSGCAYLVARLGMRPSMAVATAAIFMTSPLQLTNLPDLRDYSKAPFFLATLLVVGLLVLRRRGQAAVAALSAAAGAMVGFGFGLRTDVVINLVVVLAAVTLFLPGRLRESWKPRLVGAAACLVAFTVVAFPIVRSQTSGSNLWHWALLGYAHDYDEALDIAKAPYEPGYFYSDSYVATVVDAFWGRVTGAASQVSVGIPQYATASRAYYLLVLTTFPADALVRGWAAVIRILDLPYSGEPPIPSRLLPGWLARIRRLIGFLSARLAGIGLPLFAAVALAVSTRSIRLAALIVGLVVFLGAYPAIQFQERHIFQLELLALWTVGVAVSSVCSSVRRMLASAPAWPNPAQLARPSVHALVFGTVVLAFVVVPLATVRAYQQRTATALLASYESAARTAIDIAPETLGNGLVRVAGRESLTRHAGARSMFSDMLGVEVTGDRCLADQLTISFRYVTPNQDADFSRTLTLAVPDAGRLTRLFFPIYETGSGSPDPALLAFGGVELAESDLSCVKQLFRFTTPDSFPLLLTTVLPSDWRTVPLHQTLRGWERSVQPAGERAVTYWAPPRLRDERWSLLARSAAVAPGVGADVDYVAPIAHLTRDGAIIVSGVAAAPSAYLVAWKPRAVRAAAVVVVEGTIERGGVTVGLTERSAWVTRVDVATPGAFRAVVQAPHAGDEQLVIASNLADGSLRNALTISRIALVDGNP